MYKTLQSVRSLAKSHHTHATIFRTRSSSHLAQGTYRQHHIRRLHSSSPKTLSSTGMSGASENDGSVSGKGDPKTAATTQKVKETIHHVASAFSLSGASGLYDRARPTYPPQAVDHILSLLPRQAGNKIVDVGSGTGIFTRQLLQQARLKSSDLVESVLAVEPSEGMRTSFNERLNVLDEVEKSKVKCQGGTFWEIPIDKDGEVDMVTIAQAFHWSTPNEKSALKEAARVVQHDGSVMLIWNLEDRDTKWVAGIRDVYEQYEDGSPQYRLGKWKSAFPSDYFLVKEEKQFKWSIPVTLEGVLERICSKSYITGLGEESRKEVVEECRKIVEKGEKVWIDKEKGIFEYPYVTDLWVLQKAK